MIHINYVICKQLSHTPLIFCFLLRFVWFVRHIGIFFNFLSIPSIYYLGAR